LKTWAAEGAVNYEFGELVGIAWSFAFADGHDRAIHTHMTATTRKPIA
jgi:hypothetical protein